MLGNFPTKEHFRQMSQLSLKCESRNGSTSASSASAAAAPKANNSKFPGLPRLLDLESGHGLWRSNVDMYMSHFEPEETQPETEPQPSECNNSNSNSNNNDESHRDTSVQIYWSWKRSPNYYSDMNEEHRDESLKSLISYCKNSLTQTS